LRTNPSNVPIAEPPLLSALRNRSFSDPEAIPMSPSAVPRADRPGSQSVPEAATEAATDPDARCFRQHVPSVVRIPKYPLSLAVIGRSTVAIATVK